MKLATRKDGSRDGSLIVVSRDLRRCLPAPPEYPTLQAALDDWHAASPRLMEVYGQLAGDDAAGDALDMGGLLAPLPRAYQWLDGSAYLNHVELVRRARGAEMPPEFLTDPLMYQGGSDGFLSCRDDIVAVSEAHGIDLEAEVCVVTDDVPLACPATEAAAHIVLLGIVNDVSLRNLIPAELAKGFGFMQSKPPTACGAVFVTPDELGAHWRDAKVHLPMLTWVNGAPLGQPNCGDDMQFGFDGLIAHAARTRPLGAGTVLGSGTISNRDAARGFGCLAEARTVEVLRDGEATTPFLKFGDRVKIDMVDDAGDSIFGSIEQTVRQAPPPPSP